MKGVTFLKDETSNKSYVQIELKTLANSELWEDIFDLITIELRKDEESISWEQVKKNLKLNRKRQHV